MTFRRPRERGICWWPGDGAPEAATCAAFRSSTVGGGIGCLLALPANGITSAAGGPNFAEVALAFRISGVSLAIGMALAVMMLKSRNESPRSSRSPSSGPGVTSLILSPLFAISSAYTGNYFFSRCVFR